MPFAIDRILTFVRWLLNGLIVLVTIEIGAGALLQLAEQIHWARTVHLWLGHAVLIGCWIAMLMSLPAAVVIWVERRTMEVMGLVSLSFGIVVASLLATFTGYLFAAGPGADSVTRETWSRFLILHEIVLPALLLGSTVVMRLQPSVRRRQTIQRGFVTKSSNPTSNNPYQSPSVT